MCKRAVNRLGLSRGDSVLEIGCGPGNSFAHLHEVVGSTGHIFGVDISPGMLSIARRRCETNRWHNVELYESDAADYQARMKLDGVLFSLSYNTIPHHRSVLRNVCDQLRSGGRLVIMDAKIPPGFAGQRLLPFCLWLMKRTMLGNPFIRPWEELATVAQHINMSECRFRSYYICDAVKQLDRTPPLDRMGAPDKSSNLSIECHLAE